MCICLCKLSETNKFEKKDVTAEDNETGENGNGENENGDGKGNGESVEIAPKEEVMETDPPVAIVTPSVS